MDVGAMVLIAVAALATLTAAVWLIRRAPRHRPPDVSPSSSLSHGVPDGAEGVSKGQVLLVPLPTERNEALVLGAEAGLDALEASGLTRRTDVDHSPLPQVVRAVLSAGGGEATKRASTGVDQGRIVALSEETMKQLKANKQAFDKAGNALGVVRGKKGRIAHVARFDKAGAKAMTASNAATLAMTAALSQQLAAIEKQLTAIQGTLDGLVADVDRRRLAGTVATNKELASVARAIQRRGQMTEADWDRVAGLSLAVTTNATEADFKLHEILGDEEELNRHQRLERLEELLQQERLEYWLALQVEAELALARRDLLYLYWEQVRHPESAAQLADEVRLEIRARQEKLFKLGRALDRLSDPEARALTDPVRQLSRRRLVSQDKLMSELLERHGSAFAGPEMDPYAVIPDRATEMLLLDTAADAATD